MCSHMRGANHLAESELAPCGVCHLVALCTVILRWPRTYSGQASVLLGRSVRTRRPFHGRPRTGRASGTFRLDRRRTGGLGASAITFDSRRLDRRGAGPAACWTSS